MREESSRAGQAGPCGRGNIFPAMLWLMQPRGALETEVGVCCFWLRQSIKETWGDEKREEGGFWFC